MNPLTVIHSLKKCLSAYSVSGTIVGIGNSVKKQIFLPSRNLHSRVDKQARSKEIRTIMGEGHPGRLNRPF